LSKICLLYTVFIQNMIFKSIRPKYLLHFFFFISSSLVKELATYQVQYELKSNLEETTPLRAPSSELCELCHKNKYLGNRVCKFCRSRLCNGCSFPTGGSERKVHLQLLQLYTSLA